MENTEKNLEIAASKAGMDAKTARKYRRLSRLPSEFPVKPRGRRPDPFAGVWSEVRELLEVNGGLEAKTVFEHLQRQYPGQFQDGQVRTFQRKVKHCSHPANYRVDGLRSELRVYFAILVAYAVGVSSARD